ncbi:TatD family hydrolase [Patescibacteria group bacterium]|nr:TatD family hydrolase [Patescibacteria group bacterium]
MLIDTHTHLNFNAFKDDTNEIIKRTLENDIWMINVGSQYTTSKRAVEIAERYDKGVFAAIGLHPIHLQERKVDASEIDSQAVFKTRAEEFDYESYKKLAQNPKVVAIGEIGLDYYYKPKTKNKLEQFKQKQKETFLKQFNLAKELNLPVILHCRVAHNDLIHTLNTKYQLQDSAFSGVIHCFTGNLEQTQKFLELGFYIGLNGLILKNVPALPDPVEIINQIPLERILLETDSPYLTPPQAKEERNQPVNVRYVAERIAQIKKVSYEKVARITTQNAKELFKI